jgi:nucleoside-diphosphate-sugar epimerase
VAVLVTGATGFVGSQVLEQLLERQQQVRVLALPDTLEHVHRRDRVEIVAGSLSDEGALAAATRDVDVVFHLAAIHLSALRAIADPRDLRTVNVDGTERLLRACAVSHVRRIVFTSSVAVYNAAPWPSMWPIDEAYPPRTTGEANLRNYALSKIEAEALIRRAHQEHGIEAVVLRAAAVYGPGAPWFERIVRALAANPWSALTAAGRFSCNQWIHRRDLARALVLGGTQTALKYELCNVAGPELFSARDLLVAVSRGLRQGRWKNLFLPEIERTARYAHRYDVTRAQSRIGFTPQIKLDAGVAEVLASMSPPPAIVESQLGSGERSTMTDLELF